MKFTHRGIASLEPRAARYVVWDDDRSGLGVRVTPQGTKTFVLAYLFDGKSRLHTIGSTAGVALREAFVEYHEAMAKIERAKIARLRGETPAPDLDPAGVQVRKRAERRAAETVAELWTAYSTKKAPTLRPKTKGEYLRIMDAYVLPDLGALKAREVRPKDVKLMLNKVEARGISMANRTRALVSALFAYAVDELIIESNPVKLVRSIKGEAPRQRALAEEFELRGFFVALDEIEASAPVKRALQLLLATGVRPGEAMSMRWKDLDEAAGLWTIPEEFMKTKREHVVPLSPFALALLEESRAAGIVGDWVFPSASGKDRLSDFSLAEPLLVNQALFGKHKISPFRPHDLRRTCRTWLAKLQVPETIAERVIGHATRNRLVATYDTHDYLAEKRAALDLWGATLTAIRAGSNVVAIGKAA